MDGEMFCERTFEDWEEEWPVDKSRYKAKSAAFDQQEDGGSPMPPAAGRPLLFHRVVLGTVVPVNSHP
jgi:hypothetical protein